MAVFVPKKMNQTQKSFLKVYITGFSMESLTTRYWGIVQTASKYCQELFPGKREVLIWQLCELLTAMVWKCHVR